MGIFEFITESPVLSFFMFLIVLCFIENLAKIFKGNNND